MPSVGPSPYPDQLRAVMSWTSNNMAQRGDSQRSHKEAHEIKDWTQSALPEPDRSTTKLRPLDAILWWEIRRILFNLILLAAGTVSLVLIFLVLSWIPSATDGVQSVFAIFMYVVSANVIYTLGWISELLWSGGDTTRTAKVRPRVFRMGLMFSAAITLLPAALAPAIWVLWGYR